MKYYCNECIKQIIDEDNNHNQNFQNEQVNAIIHNNKLEDMKLNLSQN